MISIKASVVTALTHDATLLRLLGGANVFHQYPPEKFKGTELVTYEELGNEPEEYGDEEELVGRITIRIDPWSTKSITEIAVAVDRIMTALGGKRTDAPDDDTENPLHSKTMSYTFIVDRDGTIY